MGRWISKFGWLLLLLAAVPARASIAAALTVTGSEQAGDSGTITISFNGFSESVSYSQFSSAASIASAFGAKFARDFGAHVCTHAVGSTILVTLKGEATFGAVGVTDTGSPSSFQVNTSQWPANLVNSLVALVCDPNQVISGNSVSCTASVASAATGTMTFYADGAPVSTVALSSGSATVTNLLGGGALGPHLITASYSGDGSYAAASADSSVTVTPAAGSLTAASIYSYAIQSYAPNGNITAYTDSVNGSWTSIGYDSLNRLTGAAWAPPTGASEYFCWSYDAFGNRTLQATAPAAFQSNCQPQSGTATTYTEGYNTSNQLTSTPYNSISYTAAGDPNSDDNNQYLYDDEGRVCAVQAPPPLAGEPNSLTGYLYDAEGNRVAKGALTSFSCDLSANGFTLTRSYGYDTAGDEVTETGGDGQWIHSNVYAAGMLLATYDGSGTHFHVVDWLGSRRVQTDYLGRVEQTWQNLPFGEMLPTGILAPLGATTEHFTGKQHDDESGNDYFGARFFASTFGRFMSPDSGVDQHLEDPQSWNLYAYVRNNPLSHVDPTGEYLCGTGVMASMCTNFQKSLDAAQAAANKLKAYYGDTSSQYTDAQRAISAYGKEGVDNGVTLNLQEPKPGDAAGVDPNIGSASKTADNPLGIRINVNFGQDMFSGSADNAPVAAHEGSHVADGQDWAGSGFSPAMDPTRYGTESRAFHVGASIAEGTGWPYYGAIVGNQQIFYWKPGWTPAQVNSGINQVLSSPAGHYHLTPNSKILAFQHNTKGGQ